MIYSAIATFAAVGIWIYFIVRAAKITRDYGSREDYETFQLMKKEKNYCKKCNTVILPQDRNELWITKHIQLPEDPNKCYRVEEKKKNDL